MSLCIKNLFCAPAYSCERLLEAVLLECFFIFKYQFGLLVGQTHCLESLPQNCGSEFAGEMVSPESFDLWASK